MKHIIIATALVCLNLTAAPVRIISPASMSSGTFTITSTGTYVFSDDIFATADPAILITSSNVVLDLNGRTLLSNGNNAAITLADIGNITIRNGSVCNFAAGLSISGARGISNVLVENILVQNVGTGFRLATCSDVTLRNCISIGNLARGINIDSGRDITIDSCILLNNVGRGISVGSTTTATANIMNCIVFNNGNSGITLQIAADTAVQNTTCVANGATGVAGINIMSTSVRSIISNCYLYANGTGFTNDSATSGVIGSMAFANTTTNYTGAGAISAVSVNRNSQLAQGARTDIRYDNLAIT